MTQNPPTELLQAIEQLYGAFASVPKPEQIDGCPCCVGEREIETLLHKPRRELTSNDLGPIWSSCPFTVGEWQTTFRYYLPRLVELEALDIPYGCRDITGYISASRRTEAGDHRPQPWEEGERQALLRFLGTMWRTAPAWPTDPLYCPYDSILESVALLGESVAPYLQNWLTTPPIARWSMAYFVACYAEHWEKGETGFIYLEGDFEEGNAPQREQVLADLLTWWYSPELRRVVETLPFDPENAPEYFTQDVQHEFQARALAALP